MPLAVDVTTVMVLKPRLRARPFDERVILDCQQQRMI